MKLKLHDLIYLACLYDRKGIVEDIIQHQQRRGDFDVSNKLSSCSLIGLLTLITKSVKQIN